MAIELGNESLYEPAADDVCPSDGGIAHALREPVSAAAVTADLLRLLGIELPVIVMALEDTLAASTQDTGITSLITYAPESPCP